MGMPTKIKELVVSTKKSPVTMLSPIHGAVHYLVTPFANPLTRRDHELFLRRISNPDSVLYPQKTSEEVVTNLNVLVYAYTKEVVPTVWITNATMYFILKEAGLHTPNARWEITMFPDATITMKEL